ncbi:hypothetical protein ONZ45_g4359 [Pleurotus djamor]|nr:hypothetical protein ONZ45_g4359 [Pleurotus djamor]
MQFMRSSYSSDLVMNNADGGVQGREIPGPASPSSLRQISFVSTSTGHKFPSTPLSPPHVHAELPPHRVESAHPPENPTVPHAIVVSGLEHASRLSQWALVRVLSENRLVLDGGEDSDQDDAPNGPDGVWNLPDNFILVYVCAIDPHERPGIHHSLLDKFAMSTTVTLQPATRNTVKAYRTHSGSCSTHCQSFRSSPSLTAMPLPIISPRPMYPGAHSPPNIRNPSPSLIRPPLTPLIPRPSSTPFMMDADPPPGLLPPTILPMLRTMFASKSQLQISPHLLLYAADLFSAVRHHPQLEGTLLTTRSHTDALDLSRAARLLGIDLTGMEMIKLKLEENAVGCHGGGMRHRSESETVDGTSNIEYGERMSDVYSGISSGMGLLSPFGDVDSRRSYEVRSPSFLTESAVSAREGDDEGESDVLDVSEADIARIVPRVVSHRVRVRDGPQDEVLASLVFGAVPPTIPPEAWTRSSVKDIIISILAEV